MKSLVQSISDNRWNEIRSNIVTVWRDITNPREAYNSINAWKKDMLLMERGKNEQLVNKIIDEIIKKYNYNQNELDNYYEQIAVYCSTLASEDLASW